MAAVSCPLCGAPNAACGGQGTPHIGITFGKATIMAGELHPYDVEVNGTATTLLLSESDAKERGLTKKAAAKPANKSRTAPNKGAADDGAGDGAGTGEQ